MSNDPLAFKRHVLPSGTRLYYQHRPLPFTGCRVLIHAGSRQDPPGKLELMHLLEHLVGADMRGIPSRTLTQLERWIAKQRFECMLGETMLDYTAYDASAANARFECALDFLRQLTLEPTLSSQLDKERDIIRREREENGSLKLRNRKNARAAFVFGADDPLARSEAWATDAELDGLTIEDARTAHRRWYHPANMSLIVIGGIGEDEALRSAEKLLVPASRPFEPAPVPPERTFTFSQKRPVRERAEGTPELATVTAYWYMPLCDAMTLNIAVDALRERLNERIREKRRDSYGVDYDIETHRDHRIVFLSVQVKPGKALRTKKVMMEEAQKLAEFDDLQRFADEQRMFYEFMEPDIDDTFDSVTIPIVLRDSVTSVADALAHIDTITTEGVRTLAREHLSPERAYVEIVER